MPNKGCCQALALAGANVAVRPGRVFSRLFAQAGTGSSAASSPVLIPDLPIMKFDEIGFYLVGYAYRGQMEKCFPVGAELNFELNPGIACRPDQPQNGRQTFLLQCPSRNGTGVAFQQFTVQLPLVKSITLQGATVLRKDAVGKSDGVTFRLYVDQGKLLDMNQSDDVWRPYSFDLTSSGGRTVDIRFETDPGPADNPAFDFSLWGDRQLVLEGYEPPVPVHPVPPPLDLKKVVVDRSSVIPSCGFGSSTSISLEEDTAVLRYSGEDGTLSYRWHRPSSAEDPPLGLLTLEAQLTGDSLTSVPLANGARIEWTEAAAWQQSQWETSPAGLTLVTSYRVGAELVSLRAWPSIVKKSLVIDVSCDRDFIGAFTAGTWGPVFRKRPMTMPYYSGLPVYLDHENLFANTFLDWTASSATWFDGTIAWYEPRTDGSRALVKERVIFTAAWHPAEVLPNIPNPPSPHRDELSGRLVLDVWFGHSFFDIVQRFRELASYGLDRCAAIIHDWQRSGYDNALPMHIPARQSLGGEDGMRELTSAASEAGYLVALHENYADYYPNYDYFNENDISLDSAGLRVLAFYNPVTGIQSFGERPDAMVRLASTQSPEIHRRYGTTASYLDVNSAVDPFKNIDHRASTNQSAQFSQYADNARELWQYLRDTHGGPVFGEGWEHWYWSGLLDGVESQFGVGWPVGLGPDAPLLVDFDLLKIHPLQVNHGMGYCDRWWNSTTGATPPPMVLMDQYRMQEIAYGHAPFIDSTVFWSNIPLAWLEHHLVTPVALQYGASQPARISYLVDGAWQDSTAAAKRQSWDRVRVEYENGLTVTANGTVAPMEVGSLQLSAFGWLAQGQNLTAYTALLGGAIVDFADTGIRLFANARNALDWDFTPPALPSVADFAQTRSRGFRVTYQWQVFGRIAQDYQCFIHFVVVGPDGSEQISFQQDHPLSPTTSSWNTGTTIEDGPYDITLPEGVADGDYQWMIGLYLLSGPRLPMIGGDGQSRVHLGILHVRDKGQTVTFEVDTHAQQALERYRQNVNTNPQVIDFGPVRTDGSILIRNAREEWVLQTLPRDRAFTILLDSHRFGTPSTVTCKGGSQPYVAPQPAGPGWWRLPMTGAQEYRWDNSFWKSVFERRSPRQPRSTR